MSAPIIRGAQLPPAPKEPEYDVVGLPQSGQLDALFLGDLIWGIDCHWITEPGDPKKGHSERCVRAEGDCPLCGVYRSIWLGFAPIIDLGAKVRRVFRMGPETAKSLRVYAGRIVSWHGMAVCLRKAGQGRTAGASVELTRLAVPSPVPHPHSMSASIRRVLRCQSLPDFHLDADESLSVPLSDENGGVS